MDASSALVREPLGSISSMAWMQAALHEASNQLVGALLVLACTLCVASLLSWWCKERKLLSGPPSWPFIGGTLSLILNLHRLHDYVTDYSHRFGTFRVAYPTFTYFFTTNPANVEHMLKTNFNNYAKGQLIYDIQQEVFGDGIFSVDGMEWKLQRKIASYEFASKHLKELSEMAFTENAIKLAKFIMLEADEGSTVEMQDAFLRLIFYSYCKVGFGLDMSILQKAPPADQLAFINAFDDCSSMMFGRYVDPLWKLKRWLKVGKEVKFAKDVATLDSFVYSLIEQRRKELVKGDDNKHDLLSRFLAFGRDDDSKKQQYTDRQLRDIILNFMIAGRDTTAVTLSWFLYCVCKNPAVQEKIVEELSRIEPEGFTASMPKSGFPSESQIRSFAKLLTYEKLTSLHYLQACLQETLRLFPPAPLDMRQAQGRDVYPDGMTVNKGDYMVVAAYAMGRMASLWGEDVEDFKPERFIKDGFCEQPSPFKLPAFWGGPRMCLGKDFALLQMRVTIAILLRFFRFEIARGHNVQCKVMLTLHMSEPGLRVHVLPRS